MWLIAVVVLVVGVLRLALSIFSPAWALGNFGKVISIGCAILGAAGVAGMCKRSVSDSLKPLRMP